MGEGRAARAVLPLLAGTTTRAIATAKELLEKIAEARAIEMEFRTIFGTSAESTLRLRGLAFRMLPVRSQFIILPPFLRIAENFVCLVECLEFFLGTLFVFGDIGMMFARELAEGLLDCAAARVPGNAENVVVVLEFNGHGRLRGSDPNHSR